MINKKQLIDELTKALKEPNNDIAKELSETNLFNEVVDINGYTVAIGYYHTEGRLYEQKWENNNRNYLSICHWYANNFQFYKRIGMIIDPTGKVIKGIDETSICHELEDNWIYPSTQYINKSDNIKYEYLIEDDTLNLFNAFTKDSSIWAEVTKFNFLEPSIFSSYTDNEEDDRILDLITEFYYTNKVSPEYIEKCTNKHFAEQQFLKKLNCATVIANSIKEGSTNVENGLNNVAHEIYAASYNTYHAIEDHADAVRINIRQ